MDTEDLIWTFIFLFIGVGVLILWIKSVKDNYKRIQMNNADLNKQKTELERKLQEKEKEQKTITQVLEETHIMRIFRILYSNESPLAKKDELQKLWEILPYYPPDWEYRKHIVRERDAQICQKCHRKIPYEYISDDNYIKKDYGAVHHIKPLSQKGTNEFENLQLLCEHCHKKIHKKMYNDIFSKLNTNRSLIEDVFLWPEYTYLLSKHYSKKGKNYKYRMYDEDEYEDPGTDDYYGIPREDWYDDYRY